MVSPAGDSVYAKFSEVNAMNYSTFLLFLPSNVMILLAFLSCLIGFFFFLKDQIASFQLEQIIVFLNCVPCVCLFHFCDCDGDCL